MENKVEKTQSEWQKQLTDEEYQHLKDIGQIGFDMLPSAFK